MRLLSMRIPLKSMPFVEPRSLMKNAPLRRMTAACLRETLPSLMGRSDDFDPRRQIGIEPVNRHHVAPRHEQVATRRDVDVLINHCALVRISGARRNATGITPAWNSATAGVMPVAFRRAPEISVPFR